MFTSKSGKKFGSAYVGKRHDMEHEKMAKDVLGDSPEHEAKESKEFEAGEQEGMKETPEHDPKAVVAEHGPATSIHVTHDHKNKKHHVTSTHTSGHVHDSDHAAARDAHSHAAALAEGDQPLPQSDEESQGLEFGGTPKASGSIPKLA